MVIKNPSSTRTIDIPTVNGRYQNLLIKSKKIHQIILSLKAPYLFHFVFPDIFNAKFKFCIRLQFWNCLDHLTTHCPTSTVVISVFFQESGMIRFNEFKWYLCIAENITMEEWPDHITLYRYRIRIEFLHGQPKKTSWLVLWLPFTLGWNI